MGCVDRVPRRKYHSLLTVREPGYGDPLNVLTEIEETISMGQRNYQLHAFNYGSQIYPQGYQFLSDFSHSPAPKWTYRLEMLNVVRVVEIDKQHDNVRVIYTFSGVTEPFMFKMCPLVACRPIHLLTKENPFLDGSVKHEQEWVYVEPYHPLPRFYMNVSGKPAVFTASGKWNRGICYSEEHTRGYPAIEDIFSPGEFTAEIRSDCTIAFHFGTNKDRGVPDAEEDVHPLSFRDALGRAASKFLITRKNGLKSVIAGYPWFEDWVRDTMISMPGLCLSNGDVTGARAILESFTPLFMKSVIHYAPTMDGHHRNVMLDAPLHYIRAVQAFSDHSGKNSVKQFMPAVYSILEAFKTGVDSRIRMTPDGGIFTDPGNSAMTWMDALVDGKSVTQRGGYPVEINALFYNAMQFALDWARSQKHTGFIDGWKDIAALSGEAFIKRFWSEERGYFADCAGNGENKDLSLRPNQLWAIAIPFSPVPIKQAQRALESIRQHLLTPVGLRTLSPKDPKYIGYYRGNQRERDLAYHQGAVWPWLIGIYADAVARVHGIKRAREELKPVLNNLENHLFNDACLGQISEVFGGDEPHAPGGTPAQAWSVAEVTRVMEMFE